MRLACLNAVSSHSQQESSTGPSAASLQSIMRWVGIEKGLAQLLRERIDHNAETSTFFVEDFDPIAVDMYFSLLAQMQAGMSVDLNALTRWGGYSASQTANEALSLLAHWRQRFRLTHDLVEMVRSLVLMQKHVFQHPHSFHLHSDGQTLMAVWEGQAGEDFNASAPKHLLDLEKLPHSILFNRRNNNHSQLAVIWPLIAPVGGMGILRCMIILEPAREEKPSISLQSVG